MREIGFKDKQIKFTLPKININYAKWEIELTLSKTLNMKRSLTSMCHIQLQKYIVNLFNLQV